MAVGPVRLANSGATVARRERVGANLCAVRQPRRRAPDLEQNVADPSVPELQRQAGEFALQFQVEDTAAAAAESAKAAMVAAVRAATAACVLCAADLRS